MSAKPMHHPRRYVRSLSTLAGRVACGVGNCQLAANVISTAVGRNNAIKGRVAPRLTIEALCPSCGYQTIYYDE